MKLSEIQGERVYDVIADLVEPLCNIAADEEATSFFTDRELPKGVEKKDFIIQKIRKALPALMRNHKNDLNTIFATINDVPVEEYAKTVTLQGIIANIAEMLNDEDLLGFLSS